MRYLIRMAVLLAACLVLPAFGTGYAQELLCVTTQEYSALLKGDGTEVIPPGVCSDVFCVIPGQAYAAGFGSEEKTLYALCDSEGALLTEAAYEMLDESDGVIVFRQDGKFGAMDAGGNVLVPAQYTQLVTNGQGGFLAMNSDPYDDEPDQILTINGLGETLLTEVSSAEGLSEVSDGRMPFRSPATEKYGYVDAEGGVAIEATLDYGGAFESGMARASLDERFGVLSPSGEWLISPKYSFLEIGSEVIIGLQGRETCIVWDRATCSELFRVDGRELSVALIGRYPAVMDGEGVCVYDADGSLFVEAGPNATVVKGAGDQLVLSDGDWGAACVSIVAENGVRLDRRDQHLLVLDDARYGFMTMNVAAYDSQALGDIRYSCDYDSMRFGMLDAEGNEILPAQYLEIRTIGADRYLLIAEEGEYVADGDGTTLWNRLKEE